MVAESLQIDSLIQEFATYVGQGPLLPNPIQRFYKPMSGSISKNKAREKKICNYLGKSMISSLWGEGLGGWFPFKQSEQRAPHPCRHGRLVVKENKTSGLTALNIVESRPASCWSIILCFYFWIWALKKIGDRVVVGKLYLLIWCVDLTRCAGLALFSGMTWHAIDVHSLRNVFTNSEKIRRLYYIS